MPARHSLAHAEGVVTDVFSRDITPVLTVSPGDSVTVGSLDASGHLSRQRYPGDQPPKLISDARGHCLTWPVAVTGATPGMVLAVRFAALRPAAWGYTVAGGRDNRLTRRLGVAGALSRPPASLG